MVVIVRVWAIWFGGLLVFLWVFGLPIHFLRGENAIFMKISLLPKEGIFETFSQYLTGPYNGHYAPIAFLLELICARLFGAIEALWLVRQTLVLAALATSLTVTVRASCDTSWLKAAAIAAVLCLNPIMLTLHSWPFMWMLMAALACASTAVGYIIKFGKTGKIGAAWGSVLAGYASMHFFGVGLAYSVTAIFLTGLIALVLRKKQTWKPVAVGSILTLFHATIMFIGTDTSKVLRLPDAVMRFFALLVEEPIASARAFIATAWLGAPDLTSIQSQAVCGIFITAIATITLARKWTDAYRQFVVPTPLAVSTFALLSFVAIAALSAVRLQAEIGGQSIGPFLFGDRYLVFPMFSMVIAAGALVSVSTLTAALMIVGGLFYSATFNMIEAPKVWPNQVTSDEAFWERLKRTPDMPLSEIIPHTLIPITRCDISANTFTGC